MKATLCPPALKTTEFVSLPGTSQYASAAGPPTRHRQRAFNGLRRGCRPQLKLNVILALNSPFGLTTNAPISTIVRMRVVADTNTFLAVALDEPEKSHIVRVTAGHELVAPEVLPFEIGNALTAMLKRGTILPEEVSAAWDAVAAIPVDLRRLDVRAALGLAVRFGVYAYDAYFLECALSLRLPLLTLDRGMKHVAGELSIQIVEW